MTDNFHRRSVCYVYHLIWGSFVLTAAATTTTTTTTMSSTKIGFLLALCALAGVHAQLGGNPQVPPNPCPNIFRYTPNHTIGFYDGEATVALSQMDIAAGVYEFEVNMTVVANVAQQDGLKITILSGQQDILRGGPIVYRIIFPISAGRVLPYLINLSLNGRSICQGGGPPLGEGQVQSAMWAKSTLTTTNQVQTTPGSLWYNNGGYGLGGAGGAAPAAAPGAALGAAPGAGANYQAASPQGGQGGVSYAGAQPAAGGSPVVGYPQAQQQVGGLGR